MEKKDFTDALRAAGLDEAGLKKFHKELERRSPEGHETLLRLLGFDGEARLETRNAARQA